jgi:hypothetical protein
MRKTQIKSKTQIAQNTNRKRKFVLCAFRLCALFVLWFLCFVLFGAGVAHAGAIINKAPASLGLISGLVGYWSFDGSDMAGLTAFDRSGQGNDGTLVNDPITKVIGRIGQALKFEGSAPRVNAGSAVILDKPLSEKDLEGLKEHSIQEGIEIAGVLLYGETVLISTGSAGEIAASPAARRVLEEASFVFHTHPDEHSKEGPTGPDLEAAGAQIHHLLTRERAYAYDGKELLHEGSLAWLHDRYLERVKKTETSSDETLVRSELNLLIREEDRLNQLTKWEREAWLRGGTFSFKSTLTSSNVTSLPGSPYPYTTASSKGPTTIT